MQSYWMQMTDSATTLELRDSPLPSAGARQLLVRMHAAALNRGEFLLGGLHGKPGSWKAIGGEGAGEVVAVGAEVAGFRPGRPRHGPLRGRVLGIRADGGGRSDGGARGPVVGTGREHSADLPRRLTTCWCCRAA